jgi:hypothetical protein
MDSFISKAIIEHVQAIAENMFQMILTRLQEFKIVDLIVKVGKVLQLKIISCLLTNSYCDNPLIFLDLHENTNFPKQDYTQLFGDYSLQTVAFRIALYLIVINNLPAQLSHLDIFLDEDEHLLSIIHLKYFPIRLILSWRT